MRLANVILRRAAASFALAAVIRSRFSARARASSRQAAHDCLVLGLLLGGEGLGGCKIAEPLIELGEVLLNRIGVSARALESVDHAGLFRCECRSVHLEVVVGYAFVELCSGKI